MKSGKYILETIPVYFSQNALKFRQASNYVHIYARIRGIRLRLKVLPVLRYIVSKLRHLHGFMLDTSWTRIMRVAA